MSPNPLSPLERVQYRLLHGLLGGLGRLSHARTLALGAWLGRRYFGLWSGRRRHALSACAGAFPAWDESHVRRTVVAAYEETGRSAMEVVWRACHPEGDRLLESIQGGDAVTETFRELLARGRGILVLTGHFSNFELIIQWASRIVGGGVVTKTIRNPAVNQLVLDLRRNQSIRFLPVRHSYRECLRILRANEAIGFILDQNMIREEGIFVDFFGRPACTTPGLAMLAAQSGAPVLPLIMVRDRGGLRLVMRPALEPPADRSPETIHAFTQTCTGEIEAFVRDYPDQWIWMHNRWKTPVPGGDKGPGLKRVTKKPRPRPASAR